MIVRPARRDEVDDLYHTGQRPRTYRLPGVCIDCRAPVVWDGKRWLDSPRRRGQGTAHHCGSIG